MCVGEQTGIAIREQLWRNYLFKDGLPPEIETLSDLQKQRILSNLKAISQQDGLLRGSRSRLNAPFVQGESQTFQEARTNMSPFTHVSFQIG